MYAVMVAIDGTNGRFVVPVMDDEEEGNMALFESIKDINALRDGHVFALADWIIVNIDTGETELV